MPAWRNFEDARLVMSLSLLAAILFAVGHDRFNNSLNGRTTAYLSQEVSTNVGTLFVFLVKAAMSAAIATAYAQVLWHTLLKMSLQVKVIDALGSLTRNALKALDLKIWRRHPLLVVLAVTSWTIVLTTVFPPGSLTVSVQYLPQSSVLSTPLLDWSKDTIPTVQDAAFYLVGEVVKLENDQPQPVTSSIASQVAVLGELPSVLGTVDNSTLVMTFPAPSLECKTSTWTSDYRLWCDNATFQPNTSTTSEFNYISWVNQFQDRAVKSTTLPGPFNLTSGEIPVAGHDDVNKVITIACSNFTTDSTYEKEAIISRSAATLYVASMINGMDVVDSKQWQVTACKLVDSVYNVTVNVTGNKQRIDIDVLNQTALPVLNASWYNSSFSELDGALSDLQGAAYERISRLLGSYGMLAVLSDMCSAVAQLAYITDVGPEIFKSRLAYSRELSNITDGLYEYDGVRTYEPGLFNTSTTPSDPLAVMMEELFRNITFGVLTHPRIAGEQAVAMSIYPATGIYAYSWRRLWISYGVGLAATAVIVIIGLSVGGSYSTKFSTYLRTIPNSEVADSGADPLPARVAEAEISLGSAAIQLKRRPTYMRSETESGQGLMREDVVG